MGKLKAMAARVGGLVPRIGMAPKTADPFYQSQEWRALMATIRSRRGNRCEVPGCGSTNRVIGDHIVEIKDGGAPLDERNVRLLCHAHHQGKTAEARRLRARGSVYRGG